MHCLKCKSENMQIAFQSIVDPAKDKFGCLIGNKFLIQGS